jgi:DNA-binding NtrC family response regulator
MKLDEVVRTLSGTRPTHHERRRLRLEVVEGPDAGAHVVFDDSVRVGQKGLAQLVLKDALVSGLHCEIVVGPPRRVRDLGSKNGTFVAGVQVIDALLRPNEIITVGNTRLRVVDAAEKVAVELHPDDDFHGLVGQSAAMRALTARIARLTATDTTVLLQGEHGTGKERVAEALHYAGPRAAAPLVVVDCGSLPATLIEAELFGHERGAFTGAVGRVEGAFERAKKGTLFLDEIGELPLELQPKLLRALESRTIRRVGGNESIRVQARVVAATNRDLALEVQRGRLREDLYYRLAVVTLTLPPLREHIEDVPLLAVRLLENLGADPASYLSHESLSALMRHDWPGNVRELRNTLERAVSLLEPVAPSPAPSLKGAEPEPQIDLAVPLRAGKQRCIEAYERAYITAMLRECSGNLTEAARRAGMDRVSVHRLLQRIGLRR